MSKIKKIQKLYGKDKGCDLPTCAKYLRRIGYKSLADLISNEPTKGGEVK